METVVDVKNVTMKYKIMTEKTDSLKQFFIKKLQNKIVYEDFIALNNVSFSVNKGEVLGIVGLNGAGKSTLLKLISGIVKPTEGEIIRRKSISPLLELGAGFNGELTGIENIYLNGLMLGYSKKLIREKLDEIIAFSELEKFIHTPLKNYSSGMKARLGFSIATTVEPEILIVDEVLSVGDHLFREKSEKKMMSIIEGGATVLFVSHSSQQIRNLCDRVLWLDKGSVKCIGETDEVMDAFLKEKR